MQNNNTFSKETLSEIYDRGIIRTGFKSNLLGKLNDLRKLLGLPERIEAIKVGEYDQQVYQKLCEIDFSALDHYWFHNISKMAVLNLAGFGLTPSAEEADQFTVEVTGEQ